MRNGDHASEAALKNMLQGKHSQADHLERVDSGNTPQVKEQSSGVSNGAKPQWDIHDTPVENQRPIKVIVIGAGYSGIYLGIRIPERIRNCELVIYDKNDGIGGTW